MSYFVANLLLALLWAAATASFTLSALLSGFVLGFLVLAIGQPVLGRSAYFRKTFALIGFLAMFLKEIVKANLLLAQDVVTLRRRLQAGFIAVHLEARTAFEVTALANLLTLTPGTLSLDVSEDCRVLYVHAMFRHSPEEVRTRIKEGFERRLLGLLR